MDGWDGWVYLAGRRNWMFVLNLVFWRAAFWRNIMASVGLCFGGNFVVNCVRPAAVARSAWCSLVTDWTAAVGPRKTTGSLHLFGRSQEDLPATHWLLSSNLAFKTTNRNVIPCCALALFVRTYSHRRLYDNLLL